MYGGLQISRFKCYQRMVVERGALCFLEDLLWKEDLIWKEQCRAWLIFIVGDDNCKSFLDVASRARYQSEKNSPTMLSEEQWTCTIKHS